MAGNNKIGALRVTLGLDTAELEKGAKKAGQSIDRMVDHARTAGAALGVALGGAAVGLGVMVKGSIDAADELAKLSQKVGLTVEELSRLKHAGALSDVSMESLSTALRKLNQNMVDVADGVGDTAKRAFEALGISVKDAEGNLKDNSEILTEVATRFGKMEDGAAKTAAAMGIFGRSGADLIPLLNSGAEGLKEMADEADALGLTISTKTAKSAEAFNDNITRLQGVVAGLANRVMGDVVPALEDLTDKLVDSAGETGALTGLADGLSAAIVGSAGAVMDMVGAMDDAREAFNNARPEFSGATSDLVSFGDVARAVFEAVVVTGANVAYVFAAIAKDIKSLITQAGLLAKFDLKGAQAEDDRRTAEAAADRKAIDAFSKRILNPQTSDLGEGRLRALRSRLGAERDRLSDKKQSGYATQADLQELDELKSKLRAVDRALTEYAETAKKTKPKTEDLGESNTRLSKATDAAAKAAKAEAAELERLIASGLTPSEKKSKEAAEAVAILRREFEKGAISAAQMQDQIKRLDGAYDVVADNRPLPGVGATLTQPGVDAGEAFREYLDEAEADTQDALERMGRSFKGFFQELVADGKANWKRLLFDLLDDWGSTVKALKSLGGGIGDTLGSIAGSLGKAAGSVGTSIGAVIGKTLGLGSGNTALDLGLSIGGSALGAAAGSALGAAAASAAGSAALTGASTALATSLGWLSAAAGPIGAILGLAVGSLLKSKPSNEGALATFSGDGYAVSGNKRSSDTEAGVKAAADAILQGQQLLEAAGIKLAATVTSLDFGVRDRTDIILSDGRALTAAVGDAADAAETALLALLDGANYASDAQEKLVRSMVAAGEGFDAIVAQLNGFSAAQSLAGAIGDAILQITDPKAFALKQLGAAQDERRAQVASAADAGYLTADQLAELNAQLANLDKLELDQALAQFGDALEETTARVDAARNDLRAAYDAQVAQIEATLSTWSALDNRLGGLMQTLTRGALSGLNLTQTTQAATAAYLRTRAGVQAGDEKAIGEWTDVASDYLNAVAASAPDQRTYAQALADVKANTARAQAYAAQQVSSAEAQLNELEALVDGLLTVNESVLSVRDAIANLSDALTAQAVANDNASGGSAVANGLPAAWDWEAYWKANPDLAANRAAGGVLAGYGSDMEAAIAHWLRTGQFETAAGTRIPGFANQGTFKVGGFGGIDSQLMQMRMTPGEMGVITKGDTLGNVADALARMASRLERQESEFQVMAVKLYEQTDLMTRWNRQGLYVRGAAPGAAVITDAA